MKREEPDDEGNHRRLEVGAGRMCQSGDLGEHVEGNDPEDDTCTEAEDAVQPVAVMKREQTTEQGRDGGQGNQEDDYDRRAPLATPEYECVTLIIAGVRSRSVTSAETAASRSAPNAAPTLSSTATSLLFVWPCLAFPAARLHETPV